ncbi:nucleoporin NDC1 [Danio rerio]|uniref:Nucleoporin NDC1 n=1 Tax=Danio rerio TaxID=7955 RepID=NDC1_DANRE|nr:nucleoporin NDC1 [Danio rerio]Q7SZC5.1 RecName: Full=Nucleoporin NDC1; AltName: Full=Transmembrane protein 48 [Danio rerio]AAH53915.1 Transmembrane protein 48 [Danio rerio]|eukprot:NP_956237.1 nucleoporin NDC1 [Danio rerio]
MFSMKQNCWFIRKVVIWRAVASIAWSVLLLPITTAVFVLLSRFSLFHPIQWISDCTNLLTASSTIFSLMVLCAVVLITGFFNLEFYTLVPSIPCSRVALLGTVLHPLQCVHSLVYSSMGMLVMWCASVIISGRYSTLGTPCMQNESGDVLTCLNEYHLFLLLAGAFMGYSHSFLGVVKNMYYVSFQPIQQYKYPQFKGCLPMLLKCSVIQSLYSTRNFAALYFFFGYVPRAWISSTLNLPIDSSLQPLDSLTGLLDFSLLYHLSISGTFLYFTWYLTVLIFRIYATEAYSFPVQSTFSEDAERCLPKVVGEKSTLVMKFLALQDLALLSQHSPSRRQEVFSLSQPGGHPHNWNAISGECLCLLRDLTQRLVAHQDAVASNGRVKSQSASSDTRSASSSSSVLSGMEDVPETPRPTVPLRTPGSVFKSSVGGMHSSLTAPFTPDVDSPFCSPAIRRLVGQQDPQSPWFGTVQSPHIMRRGPKLWSASTESQSNGSPPASPAIAPSPPAANKKPSFLAQWLQNRKEQVKSFLAKRVLIVYLFNKLPEASSQALFADSQAHIWALQGLSHLVAASFSEDQFGVVQTTLPSILSSLVVLLEAVDRHFKLPHASSKPARTVCSMGDSTYKTLRFALRAALKTAIYKITTTFGEHLNAVNISTEHRKRLQQFLEFKE